MHACAYGFSQNFSLHVHAYHSTEHVLLKSEAPGFTASTFGFRTFGLAERHIHQTKTINGVLPRLARDKFGCRVLQRVLEARAAAFELSFDGS